MDPTTTAGGDEKAAPSSPSDAIISDLITVTIKTIDSKNYQFQVENDVSVFFKIIIDYFITNTFIDDLD